DNYRIARQRAERIQYTVASQDSLLILPSGFGFGPEEKYRDQKVMVEIAVPAGKQIRFDASVVDKLNPFNIRVKETERYGRKRNVNRRSYEVDWDNNRYYNWEPDTDYYMTKDGELKEVGVPETEQSNPATPKDSKIDSIRKEAQRKIDSIERTGKTEVGEEPADETAKKREIGGDLPTPMPVPFVPTIF
ncbi:MAG TPA: hypothetical protein VER36_05300, partial [Flavisolibacter sp.]|nr:hypothetical protein [Flavisolibacter sp.]